LREGGQLASSARDDDFETDTPVQLKVLKSYVSTSTGGALPFGIDTDTQSNENKPAEEDDMYSGACFDLVAAALADISGSASTIESERT
jgi:hypothetical protein